MRPTPQVNPLSLVEEASVLKEAIEAFAAELLAIASPPGAEGPLVEAITSKLRALAYDTVMTDEAGNLLARIPGDSTAPSVLFLFRLDSARVPDEDAVTGPEPAEGFLLGTGASSHKGAIAAMAYAGALLKKLEVPLRGDFLLAGVVQSHVQGNVGLRYLLDKTLLEQGWHADLVVLGDPTNLNISLGHQGRVELEVKTFGRTSHSGAPWLGLNAVYAMLPVIEGIQALSSTLPSHPFLEKASIALTSITSAPFSPLVVPDRCVITLDRGFLPSESLDNAIWQVQSVLNRLQAQDSDFCGETAVRQEDVVTYTGLSQRVPKLLHPFLADISHALIKRTTDALLAIGQAPRYTKWAFPTEGGYASTIKNIVTVGYSPGDEKFAATPFDRVSLEQVVQATAGYAAIALHVFG
jgi:putative selenium metabolism hydrolase